MRNKLQKFLSLLLVLCAAITISAGNIASGTFKKGGSWSISDGGELYIDVKNVPDYKTESYGEGHDNFAVNNRIMWAHWKTKAPWGQHVDKIKSIRFSSKVEYIGKCSFKGLTSLTDVMFDSRSTNNVVIAECAFEDCVRLSRFDFSYVKEIGHVAFRQTNFSDVTLPVITSLAVDAFENCYSMFGKADNMTQGIHITSTTVPFDFSDPELLDIWYVNESETYLQNNNDGTFTKKTERYVQTGESMKIIVPPSMYSQYTKKEFENHAFKYDHSLYIVPGGENWNLSGGSLVHYGGIPDYVQASDAPWYSVRNDIKRVIITYARVG